MKSIALMLVGVLLTLSGCVSPTVWVKPGLTQAQFQADQFDCKQRVYTMYGGITHVGFEHLPTMIQDGKACMIAKGYQEEPSLPYEQQLRAPQPQTPEEKWQTPEEVWRSKYTGSIFARPNSCVGQGCVSAREEK